MIESEVMYEAHDIRPDSRKSEWYPERGSEIVVGVVLLNRPVLGSPYVHRSQVDAES